MAVALRGIPVEAALKIGGLDFAARQRHSFEDLLIPECRFLIGFFVVRGPSTAFFSFVFPSSSAIRNELQLPRTAESANRRRATTSQFFSKTYHQYRISSSTTA